MFANLYPNFAKGRILKTEMLENLRDFPRDFLNIYYQSYSNGIIAGADVIVGENTLTVTSGVIKYNGTIYLLPESYQMPYGNTNREMAIKVRFLDKASESDFDAARTKILLEESSATTADELELGRFKLREGAQLRSDYTDFFDFTTEYNTINIINVEHAAPQQSTLSPMMLRYFAALVLKSRTENPRDLAFAMQCATQERISRELIVLYITGRQGIPVKAYTNQDLYKYLTMVVRDLDNGRGMQRSNDANQRRSGPGRIMVD